MLRNQLTVIGKINDESECAGELNTLQKECPHTISIVKCTVPLNEFNCFEYALGLWNIDEYKKIKIKLNSAGFGNIFCNSYFLRWLFNKKYISRHGDLIVYESIYGDIYHAGICSGDKVTSKWGSGCIYNHEKLEVPAEYGTMPLPYNRPDATQIFQYFKQYLNELSVTINSALTE